MPIIKPFKSIRPAKEYADKVAALPYDVMNSDEAREMIKGNDFSFLRIDKAEIDLDKSVHIYDEKVYQKAKENYDDFKAKEILKQDCEESFYIYELIMDGRSQKGLVVCTSIDDYINEKIKKHELTREDKEQDRIKHVDILNANTGPIFLAYPNEVKISEIINNFINNNEPIFDFISSDNITHKGWKISDSATINNLISLFSDVSDFYIADGHHRNASAVKVALKRREENKNYSGSEEFNFYLSVLFPDNELKIMDYNRLVKDLNGLSKDDFLNKISEKFITEKVSEMYKPKNKNNFGMYLDGDWYKLTGRDEILSDDAIGILDVSVLQENILNDILNIGDIRTSDRIDFVGGIRGLKELERRVDSGEMEVAFSLYPTSMEELFKIANKNLLMPPKSTWFEPKLRSGLFIHEL